jgi:hypothetical protein
MTKRQILKFQNHVRHGVDVLYHSYIASVLRELSRHDQVGAAGSPDAADAPASAISVQREMKRRADLGCARVRERLWQLQHLQLSSSPQARAA